MMQVGIFYKVIVPGNNYPDSIIYSMGNIPDTVNRTVEEGMLFFTFTITRFPYM